MDWFRFGGSSKPLSVQPGILPRSSEAAAPAHKLSPFEISSETRPSCPLRWPDMQTALSSRLNSRSVLACPLSIVASAWCLICCIVVFCKMSLYDFISLLFSGNIFMILICLFFRVFSSPCRSRQTSTRIKIITSISCFFFLVRPAALPNP